VFYTTNLNFVPSAIAIGADGSAYLAEITHDPQFVITPGAYNRNITGGEELLVAKLNPSGTALQFVTLLGGSGYSYGQGLTRGVAVGRDGAVYVAGTTCSKDFPTTGDAFQSGPQNADGLLGCDAFFSELNADASKLVYSTYLGASQNSLGLSISLGDDGKIHLAGGTHAADFPTTPGTFTLPLAGVPVERVFLASWDPNSRPNGAPLQRRAHPGGATNRHAKSDTLVRGEPFNRHSNHGWRLCSEQRAGRYSRGLS
jgi:hypothetical protein